MALRNTDKLHKSRIQEKKLGSKMGGRVQPASGAIPMHKGDVRTPTYIIEAKRTDKKQMTLKEEWLSKISKEAARADKIPMLAIEIGGKRWVILDEDDFMIMTGGR